MVSQDVSPDPLVLSSLSLCDSFCVGCSSLKLSLNISPEIPAETTWFQIFPSVTACPQAASDFASGLICRLFPMNLLFPFSVLLLKTTQKDTRTSHLNPIQIQAGHVGFVASSSWRDSVSQCHLQWEKHKSCVSRVRGELVPALQVDIPRLMFHRYVYLLIDWYCLIHHVKWHLSINHNCSSYNQGFWHFTMHADSIINAGSRHVVYSTAEKGIKGTVHKGNNSPRLVSQIQVLDRKISEPVNMYFLSKIS